MALHIVSDENRLPGLKAYLYYFDPYVQRTFALDEAFVRRTFVLDCLIYDQLFTSLSHVLGCRVSSAVLQEHPKLLAEGRVSFYVCEYGSIHSSIDARLAACGETRRS